MTLYPHSKKGTRHNTLKASKTRLCFPHKFPPLPGTKGELLKLLEQEIYHSTAWRLAPTLLLGLFLSRKTASEIRFANTCT